MFKLTIVTPERRLLINQEVEEVTVPGFKGELNILSGHAPLITTLGTGVMKWKLKDSELFNKAVISWGYCQVSPEGVNILAGLVELPEEIELAATQEYLSSSEKKVLNTDVSEVEWIELQKEWARARSKIDLMETHLKR
jgi:F-type H+-transporting ATPase subunit epsilon